MHASRLQYGPFPPLPGRVINFTCTKWGKGKKKQRVPSRVFFFSFSWEGGKISILLVKCGWEKFHSPAEPPSGNHAVIIQPLHIIWRAYGCIFPDLCIQEWKVSWETSTSLHSWGDWCSHAISPCILQHGTMQSRTGWNCHRRNKNNKQKTKHNKLSLGCPKLCYPRAHIHFSSEAHVRKPRVPSSLKSVAPSRFFEALSSPFYLEWKPPPHCPFLVASLSIDWVGNNSLSVYGKTLTSFTVCQMSTKLILKVLSRWQVHEQLSNPCFLALWKSRMVRKASITEFVSLSYRLTPWSYLR